MDCYCVWVVVLVGLVLVRYLPDRYYNCSVGLMFLVGVLDLLCVG